MTAWIRQCLPSADGARGSLTAARRTRTVARPKTIACAMLSILLSCLTPACGQSAPGDMTSSPTMSSNSGPLDPPLSELGPATPTADGAAAASATGSGTTEGGVATEVTGLTGGDGSGVGDGADSGGAIPVVDGLTTNGRVNPLGIAARAPVFGWIAASSRRGVTQRAYEIQVGSTPGASDVWITGSLSSDQQVNVAYGGLQLESGRRYYWRVRVWDDEENLSAWSPEAWFETGLSVASDWGAATWIGKSTAGGTSPDGAPLLRTAFTTPPDKTVQSARIYASAHGVYELYLNGSKVGDQFLAPGYTEYASRIQSQTYDVTDLVQEGTNGFGGALGDGWWRGKVGLEGKGQYGMDLALIARLRVTYTDGTIQWIDTDASWRWAPGPFVATDNQLGETYDARSEQPGWDTADFDDSEWQPVVVQPSDTAKLSPQPDEPVRETALLSSVRVTRPSDTVTIYDLGQNMVGVPRVTIAGTAGETARLRHAEVLQPDGTLYTANLRAASATDDYTFAEDGTVTYQPTFTQHGFRYIEITGLASPPAADDVKGVVLGSDLPRTGTLVTSNALLNQLLRNVSWSARGNFLSIPTDTPARDERLGWTGDISIFSKTATYLSDMRAFLGKWMIDVRDEQKPNGGIPAVVPSTNDMFSESAIGWEDAIITVPHALWRAYGDAQVVLDNYAAMNRFFAYARASAGADLLEPGRTSFFTGDWLHLDDPSNQGVIGTAIWAEDVRMMAEMAAAIGRSDEAAEYAELYQDVRRAFTAAYVAADGTVLGGSQTGYALALGRRLITDPDRERMAGEKFVAKLAETDNHSRTGFIGTPLLLHALTNIGRDDLAYTMLLHDTYPSWGYEIQNGATTLWERWNSIELDGSFGPVDMNSFNHYAYGAVGDWMFQNIGGLQAVEAGYRTSSIEPHLGGGLTSAEAILQTVYGQLSLSWQLVDDQLMMNVTVPVNTRAQVRIPSGSPDQVTEGGLSLDSIAGVQRVAGVQSVSYDDAASRTVVTVGSGTYAFEAPRP
jgi:alpha-L-rhamnosidase